MFQPTTSLNQMNPQVVFNQESNTLSVKFGDYLVISDYQQLIVIDIDDPSTETKIDLPRKITPTILEVLDNNTIVVAGDYYNPVDYYIQYNNFTKLSDNIGFNTTHNIVQIHESMHLSRKNFVVSSGFIHILYEDMGYNRIGKNQAIFHNSTFPIQVDSDSNSYISGDGKEIINIDNTGKITTSEPSLFNSTQQSIVNITQSNMYHDYVYTTENYIIVAEETGEYLILHTFNTDTYEMRSYETPIRKNYFYLIDHLLYQGGDTIYFSYPEDSNDPDNSKILFYTLDLEESLLSTQEVIVDDHNSFLYPIYYDEKTQKIYFASGGRFGQSVTTEYTSGFTSPVILNPNWTLVISILVVWIGFELLRLMATRHEVDT